VVTERNSGQFAHRSRVPRLGIWKRRNVSCARRRPANCTRVILQSALSGVNTESNSRERSVELDLDPFGGFPIEFTFECRKIDEFAEWFVGRAQRHMRIV